MINYFILFTLVVLARGQETSLDSNIIEEVACTTDTAGSGLCVPYYLCSENNTIIEDGEGILNSRFGETCQKSLEVCCGDDNVSETTVRPVTTKPPPARLTGCGVRNPNGIEVQISNAKPDSAQFGEFPWMVAILRDEMVTGVTIKVYKCGGVLIHWKAALTAAHCIIDSRGVDNIEGLTARAGEWDTQIKTEIIPHQDRKVMRTARHENFGLRNMVNDIAILILESEITPTQSISPICLPETKPYADMSNCIVTGWGKDNFGKQGRYQVVMKKVELPIMSSANCQKALRRTRLGPRFKLNPSFVCAGGIAGKDTCTGDGGSPLVCPIPGQINRFELAGLVSWGIGCGDNGIPGVYTNVPFLREWISDQLIYADIQISEAN